MDRAMVATRLMLLLVSAGTRRAARGGPALASAFLAPSLPARRTAAARFAATNGGGGAPAAGEKTAEEKAAIQAAREARKAAKEQQKAEKAAKRAARAAAEEAAKRIDPVTYLDVAEEAGYAPLGDMATVMSRARSGRAFASVRDVGGPDAGARHGPGSTVWLRGRVQSLRAKGGSCFLVLRQDAFDTVQAVFFKDKADPDGSAAMLRYLKSLTVESVVDLEGTVAPADVKSCSVRDAEVVLRRVHAVSAADAALPFQVEDAARSAAEVDASQGTDRPHPRLGQELRLDHRWLDLRVPAHNAVLRVKSGVCQLFREALYARGFVEIQTPKLIAGESESGAGAFTTDYFGQEACWARELAVVRTQYASEPVVFTDEPCVLHWPEAMDILRGEGFDMGDGLGDLTGAQELALGAVVKEKYGTDFFMLDKYPADIRPFYTMPDPDDARFSNSYDMFLRGQEICSGAQRCHDPDLVAELLAQRGLEVAGSLEPYVAAFRHGVSPHAGAGIGLERVVTLYLGLDNVRKASMFPRDPNRCSP